MGDFFSAGAILLLWALVSSILEVAATYRAKQWPTVQGTVISSKAVRGCGKGSSFYPAVQDSYSVGEIRFVGHRIAFGNGGCGSENEAQDIARLYPVGQAVSVYFNSRQPNDAALVVGKVLNDTWEGIIIMTILFLGWVALAWMFIKNRTRRTD